MTFETDPTESTEDLTTAIDKMPVDNKPAWSPISSDSKANSAGAGAASATRYSHEEDSYGLSDLTWKRVEKERKWDERV